MKRETYVFIILQIITLCIGGLSGYFVAGKFLEDQSNNSRSQNEYP